MDTPVQIEKSGEHHERMNEMMKKIIITFALPAAFLLWILVLATVVMSMGIVADASAAVSAWARSASQHAVQLYAQEIFSFCWKAIVLLLTACVATHLGFHLYVTWAWPRK